MNLLWLSEVMDPIFWIPVIPAIILAIWKGADADHSLRPRSHLKRLAGWMGLSPGLYLLSYLSILGVAGGLGASASWVADHDLGMHILITGVYLSLYLFAWAVFRMEPKKTDIPTMIEMQGRHKRMGSALDDVSERNDDIAQKLVDMDERVEQNRKEMDRMREKRQERNADLHERIDEAEEGYKGVMQEVKGELRVTQGGVRNLREEVEKMKEAVKSLKGKKADEKGLSWQEELAHRVRVFGYETEVNRKGGADLVVKDPASGIELAVVSAKDYDLRTKRGLTGDIEAEMERAKEDGVPLVVALKNNLNDQELYHFCQPQDLDEFTCSAPARLTGEEATGEQKAETQEGREAFRNLLIDRTP